MKKHPTFQASKSQGTSELWGCKSRKKQLCCVSLAQVSASLGAWVAHDQQSDPFGAVLFMISVFLCSLHSEKYLRQLKQRQSLSHSEIIKNIFIANTQTSASFIVLGSIPLTLSLLELFIQTDVLISSSPVLAKAFFLCFSFLHNGKHISFELL